jgi:HD-like signal output (HDOD) protein
MALVGSQDAAYLAQECHQFGVLLYSSGIESEHAHNEYYQQEEANAGKKYQPAHLPLPFFLRLLQCRFQLLNAFVT